MVAKFGSITCLPSGKYRARYFVDGAQHSAPGSFQTKGDAQIWLDQKHRETKTRDYRSPTALAAEAAAAAAAAVPFGPYALAEVAGRVLKIGGRAVYDDLMKTRILPTFADMSLTDITPTMVRQWHATVMGDRTGKTSGNTMRKQAYVLLKSILQSALLDGLILANPCVIRGAGSSKTAHKTVIATLEQLTALTAALPERFRALVQVATWCGMRYGEVAALRRMDVEADGSEISVSRTVVRRRWAPPITDTPKSEAGIRLITVPGFLAEQLVDHLARWTAPEADALLFPSRRGNLMIATSFYHHYYPARAAAGRPDLHFHDLRHTGATWAAETGATTKQLMQRIGHATPTAALLYQHASRQGDLQIAAGLAAKAGR